MPETHALGGIMRPPLTAGLHTRAALVCYTADLARMLDGGKDRNRVDQHFVDAQGGLPLRIIANTSAPAPADSREASSIPRGWHFIEIEPTSNSKHKPGLQTLQPGSKVSLALLPPPAFGSSAADVGMVSSGAAITSVALEPGHGYYISVTFLQSYHGMGTAIGRCSGSCTCEATTLRGLHPGKLVSVEHTEVLSGVSVDEAELRRGTVCAFDIEYIGIDEAESSDLRARVSAAGPTARSSKSNTTGGGGRSTDTPATAISRAGSSEPTSSTSLASKFHTHSVGEGRWKLVKLAVGQLWSSSGLGTNSSAQR